MNITFQRYHPKAHFSYIGRCERPVENNRFRFEWLGQQILHYALNCLLSWDTFIQKTLKKSSCFVRNC